MNRLPQLTAILAAVMLSFEATAQDFPIPYNPDDDANGLIGTPDLLSLLALFGEEFSAAVVAEDNESAIMYMGDMAYPLCAQSCRNLPGLWETAGVIDLGLVWNEVYSTGTDIITWLRPSIPSGVPGAFRSNDESSYIHHEAFSEYMFIAREARCYCSIKEIPKVEYTHCGNTNFSSCVNDKVAAGWQLLGGISSNQANTTGNYSGALYQAFWRWAE